MVQGRLFIHDEYFDVGTVGYGSPQGDKAVYSSSARSGNIDNVGLRHCDLTTGDGGTQASAEGFVEIPLAGNEIDVVGCEVKKALQFFGGNEHAILSDISHDASDASSFLGKLDGADLCTGNGGLGSANAIGEFKATHSGRSGSELDPDTESGRDCNGYTNDANKVDVGLARGLQVKVIFMEGADGYVCKRAQE
jgi:hypothetical protein